MWQPCLRWKWQCTLTQLYHRIPRSWGIMKTIHKEIMEYKASRTTKDWTKGKSMHGWGEQYQAMVNVLKRHRRKILLLLLIIVLHFYSKSNLVLGVSQPGSRSNWKVFSLTGTGYYNAVSQKEMTCYNTKSITKLAITAFEIIYFHVQRVNWASCSSGQEKAWSSFFLHIYSVIILVVMQSLIS